MIFTPSWMDAAGHQLPAANLTTDTAKFSVTSSFLQVGLTPTLRNAQALPKMSNVSHLCWSPTDTRTDTPWTHITLPPDSPITICARFFTAVLRETKKELYLSRSICLLLGFPVSLTVPLLAIITRPASLSSSLPLFC